MLVIILEVDEVALVLIEVAQIVRVLEVLTTLGTGVENAQSTERAQDVEASSLGFTLLACEQFVKERHKILLKPCLVALTKHIDVRDDK